MNSGKPVFVQIIEMIEDDILSGIYCADEMIISTPQISKLLSVNPTTAQKAIGILTDKGIIYKKRGLGMAVTKDAKQMIIDERKENFLRQQVDDFVSQARKIGIPDEDLIKLVKEKLND